MDDDDLPNAIGRTKGDAASKLSAEDLAPYSQDELATRIAMLEAEIARVQAHSQKAAKHRAAADALFKGSGS
ncbi:hypothetical protein EH31_12655 [Erythrobacter longus]|uniref:DUF1192 domain-containing protein n=1 Tax=Erythrobacter longus TaxID=1044 RepID=A0A074M9N8_ERYLO|nr:DUF1192 domain-containing protein [Erythrobacter longus]KEO89490.1 hypothetical protein EH31_12655 [Erythrobacter longus]